MSRPRTGSPGRLGFGATIVALALVPLVADNFLLFQIGMAIVYAIAIAGLSLLIGLSGQFSLGHGAFFALGAYTCAILVERHLVSFYLAVPIAGVIAFAAGLMLGLPALRLKGAYLGLATFALAIAVPSIIKLPVLRALTGGELGLRLNPSTIPTPAFAPSRTWLYFVVLGVFAIMTAVAARIVRSRFGLAVSALRDEPVVAQASGINPAPHKVIVFGLSAFYSGIAGALSLCLVGYIAPDSFTFGISVAFFTGLVVAGVNNVRAAIVGGLFVVFAPYVVEGVPRGASGLMQGLVLVAIVVLAPGGVIALARRVASPVRAPTGDSATPSQDSAKPAAPGSPKLAPRRSH